MSHIQRITDQIIKNSDKWAMGLLAAGALVGAYSYKVERFKYEIKEISLQIKNLPSAFEGWRIVQFSDTHLGYFFGVEDFKPLVKMINNLQPDILFFTGDLIDIRTKTPERYFSILQELKSGRGGKWAVLGNHDIHHKYRVTQLLEDSQFTVLNNDFGVVEAGHEQLYIAGIDDVVRGYPNLDRALEGLSEDDCIFLLAHEPDFAIFSSSYPISAQFSGHSHGGQVRLPYLGPLTKHNMSNKYSEGLYYVGENKMPLYVNRGIGTTGLPLRLFCRPEITVFCLNS
ncbi:metallophosphoesterase [Bacillus sp. JJ1764]|uniref:metallophosphoesterase n=1 Tax=Bacillus sp. JJ1764 TaxID=3122964 RepID=UPI002FFD9B1B